MRESTHYKLKLQEDPDDIDIEGISDNFEKLDETAYSLQEELNEEENARTAADSALDGKITAEETARENADSALDGKIAAEKTARENADSALSESVYKKSETYTKTEIDNKLSMLEMNIDWKESVGSFSDIVAAYPNPQDGWTVNVKDTDYTYRFSGSEWVAISANSIPKATNAIDGLMSKEDKSKLDTHIGNKSNPHGTTAAQIGLGNVTNDKQATKAEFDAFADRVEDIIYPRIAVTVTITSYSETSQGFAMIYNLTTQTKLDTSKSYNIDFISSVYEYFLNEDNYGAGSLIDFQINGITLDNEMFGVSVSSFIQGLQNGKTYIKYNTNKDRWDIADAKSNIFLELGTHTSNTNNPHETTAEKIGLGNVNNTSDADKPISTATQAALDEKADRTEIIPNNDKSLYINEFGRQPPGWYRIARHGQINSGSCNSCEFLFKRGANYHNNEYHHIYFDGVQNKQRFHSVSNVSNVHIIQKIRFSHDSNYAYIDIYGNTSADSFDVLTIYAINAKDGLNAWSWELMNEYLGTNDISGQIVYDIPANSELAQKDDVDKKFGFIRNLTANDDLNELGWSTGWFKAVLTVPAEKNYPCASGKMFIGTLESYDVEDGKIQVLKSVLHDKIWYRTMQRLWTDPMQEVWKEWKEVIFQSSSTITTDTVNATTVNSSGADGAELMEWADGNPDNEDRCGYFVTLAGRKIRIAKADDDLRKVSVISGNYSFLGNNYTDCWHGKYKKDVYGRRITKDVIHPAVTDDNGNIISEEYTTPEYVLNEDYDESKAYIPRSERPEWDSVICYGQVVVRDDGTCIPDGFCKPNDEGIATVSSDGFYVMDRVNEENILIKI